MTDFYLNSDGGARGNPGPAGAGFVIEDGKKNILHESSRDLGTATNNQAEYWALIFALEWLEENAKAGSQATCRLDSKLIVEQLKGNYKVKNEGLKPLFNRVQELIKVIQADINFLHVPRRQNTRADELANEAMDKVESDNVR